ncbi:amino acid adenylation domain-containing protein [Actinomadura logoneensis]|uniref:Amino acid adenylation domain-containing protein n=1 Tax=Actinomadura logoneensis TaxID=2293572 RepID=A0A372JJ58_9ACTN|nr:non-ribosomal peptide synthetase [Actinomadura logoneensis]RFU40051.1 amino acid adenylation domain-containing protein [Actinomadura logoneensis]
MNIQQAVTAQARRNPGRVAVVAGDLRVTYEELELRSNRIAHTLLAHGVRPGEAVGVLMDRGADLVPALLGTLKSGASYVPLDPAHPADRLAYVAADSGLRHVVTLPSLAGRVPAGASPVPVEAGGPSDDPAVPVLPGSPAYVIYTSGSTGKPKGVTVEHRSAMNLLAWLGEAWADGLGGWLAATSIGFDPSVMEIFGPLVHGGTVVLADDLLALPALPAADEVTALGGPPSVLAALLRSGPLPASLRLVYSGGETLPGDLVARYAAAAPGIRFFNCYGPTECTTQCLVHEVTPGENPVPIGRPVAGAVVSVRDASGREVAPGETGELVVAGPVLARGYLGADPGGFTELPDLGRAYRTGDLARFEDGVFWFAGRSDAQVKVRGHRVEPGEVEHALTAHPAVAEAAVVAVPDADGTHRLIGYAVADASERDLLAHLADRLPAALVPDRIVLLPALPLGPAGKLDRDALPAPSAPVTPGGRAPETDTERRIAAIVADVLGLPEVGAEDGFASLGGHSLAAARVVAQVAAELGVQVRLHEFLAAPTVAGLAELVSAAAPVSDAVPVSDAAPASDAVPASDVSDASSAGHVPSRGGTHPLTEIQRGMWAMRQIDPGTPATTIGLRLRVTGPVTAAALRSALDGIVERHEELRGRLEVLDGEPVMRIGAPAPVPFAEHDLRSLDTARREDEVARLVSTLKPFDLTADTPLLRAICAWNGPDTADLLLVTDHIVFDGWSERVLREELAADLAGRTPAAPTVQFGDLAREEAEALGEDPYWRTELAGAVVPFDLLGDPASAPGPQGRRITLPVDPALLDGVRALAARLGLTPAAVQLAALATVVGGLSGHTETTLGLTATVRDRPGLDRVVGPFLEVLPVRADFTDDPGVADLAARVGERITRALGHRDGLTAAVAAAVPRAHGANPLPVVLAFQPDEDPVTRAGDVRVELVGELDLGGAVTELTLLMNTGAAGPELVAEYATDRFTEAEAALVADAFLDALAQTVADPGRRVSSLALVSAEERDRLRALGTGASLAGDETVVDAILRVDPARPAVASASGALTYGELFELSGRVASALVEAGIQPGEPVGVSLPRDHRMPAILLGVLRAGAAYVAMDADLPARRLAMIAEDCGIRHAVVLGGHALPDLVLHDAEALLAAPADGSDPAPLPASDPARLAYLIFTSGSTGRPKGIQIPHRAIASFAEAIRMDPGMTEDEVVVAMAPLVFDMSSFELWATLSVGGRLFVADSATARDGRALAALLDEVGATLIMATPSRLRLLVAEGWAGRPGLRVLIGGEVLDEALARQLTERTAGAWNVYGPSEVTVVSTVHPVAAPPHGPQVAIGHPIPGERLSVVDPLGRPVPLGVPGELWLGGPGVADGYRGRPELTAAAFVRAEDGSTVYRSGDRVGWRPDGSGGHVLVFLGRRDNQIKLRGYRIELDEIDAVLRDHPSVTDAAVNAGSGADAALRAHVVAPEHIPDETLFAELEAHARDRLPAYMVPRTWIRHAELPRTISGKLDRRALSPATTDNTADGLADEGPERASEGDGGPASDTGEGTLVGLVAEVWEAVLKTRGLGPDDEFFALGGTSLLATRATVRLREALGCDLPVWTLFDHPVLADYAAEVERTVLAQLAEQEGGA